MKKTTNLMRLFYLGLLAGCSGEMTTIDLAMETDAAADYPRGPNNGRLLEDGSFAVEVAIFETGVPPEFHVWAYNNDEPVNPGSVDLEITLTRLDGVNEILFLPQRDYLKGSSVVYEPHSFAVDVEATYQGGRHRWHYESFEGRTTIAPAMASALGIETGFAGPATLDQTLDVIGTITTNDEYSREITARFNGPVIAVNAGLGSQVREGDILLTIESNESLKPYNVLAPIDGIVTQRFINPGEQSNGQVLLEIMDPSQVWAELSIFPSQRNQISTGTLVTIEAPVSGAQYSGTVDNFTLTTSANQSITARVAVDNSSGDFPPGSFIEATLFVAEIEVPLAVKREGLQAFRDFTVVYAKVGDTYEVRMLELGREDSTWVEVLGGLTPGTEYVTTNSYILKADVEKSGASHDH